MLSSISIPIRLAAHTSIGEFPRHGLILKVMEDAGLDLDDSVVDAVLQSITPALNELELKIESLAIDLLTQQWQDAQDYESTVRDVRSIR